MMNYSHVFEAMADNQIPLLVHAESTDDNVDIFDREAAFLERELAIVCEQFPELKVTVEHISTSAGIDFVKAHPQVGGSITPHHLDLEPTPTLVSLIMIQMALQISWKE